jgi:hypothetical protein
LARGPTTKLEGELDALKRDHSKLISEQAEAVEAARQAEFEAIEKAAATETAAIIERVKAVLPPIVIETPQVNEAPILAAARGLARARTGLDKASAIHAEKLKLADSIAGLITEHETTLAQIGDRLMAGGELPSDDMARLRSVQFLERKRPLHAAAMAEVRAAEQAVRLAETVRQQASVALTRADDEARAAGYNLRLNTLDAALIEVLGLAAAVNKRIPQQPQYIGSHELRHALQRLAITYPNMARDLDPADPRKWAAMQRARQLAAVEEG